MIFSLCINFINFFPQILMAHLLRVSGISLKKRFTHIQRIRLLKTIFDTLDKQCYISEKMAPHPYMSYIFRNVLMSSFTWSVWNWSYDMKIPQKLLSENRYRFLAKSLYFAPIPIENQVISRCCAFWPHFLYNFI